MAGELELDDFESSSQCKPFCDSDTHSKIVGINILQDVARLVLS